MSPEIGWQRVGAYVLCQDAGGRVLLTQFELVDHPNSGAWTMPGGGMEFGEQPAETAAREFVEETGLTVEVGEVLGVVSLWFDADEAVRGAVGQSVAVLFAGTHSQGVLKTDFSDDDTTGAAGWFGIEEVGELRRVPLVDYAMSKLEAQADR